MLPLFSICYTLLCCVGIRCTSLNTLNASSLYILIACAFLCCMSRLGTHCPSALQGLNAEYLEFTLYAWINQHLMYFPRSKVKLPSFDTNAILRDVRYKVSSFIRALPCIIHWLNSDQRNPLASSR